MKGSNGKWLCEKAALHGQKLLVRPASITEQLDFITTPPIGTRCCGQKPEKQMPCTRPVGPVWKGCVQRGKPHTSTQSPLLRSARDSTMSRWGKEHPIRKIFKITIKVNLKLHTSLFVIRWLVDLFKFVSWRNTILYTGYKLILILPSLTPAPVSPNKACKWHQRIKKILHHVAW